MSVPKFVSILKVDVEIFAVSRAGSPGMAKRDSKAAIKYPVTQQSVLLLFIHMNLTLQISTLANKERTPNM